MRAERDKEANGLNVHAEIIKLPIDRALKFKLARLARREGRSMNSLVRNVLADYGARHSIDE